MMHKAARLLALAAPAFAAADVFPPPVSTVSFTPYPGYTGPLNQTSGMVSIGQDGMDMLVLFFALQGVDPMCSKPSTATNGCGLHVHSGTECGPQTGGHFFDEAISPDPWLPVMYTATPMGAMGSGIRVKAGKTLSDLDGKAFVIHDFGGNRISCGLLMAIPFAGDTLYASMFARLPSYYGALNSNISGIARVMQVNVGPMAAQVIAFNLTGADPNCKLPFDAARTDTCGIRIHSGVNCNDTGGHYFSGSTDPWIPIRYTTQMGVSAGVTTPVPTGLTRDNITNHVIVVRDNLGIPFACSPILMAMPNSNTNTNTNANFAKATFASPALLAILAVAHLLS